MIFDIVLLAFVVALARGGSFKSLGNLQLRNLWLAFIAPVIIIILAVARRTGSETEVVRIGGYFHIAVLVPWLILLLTNRKIPGTAIIVFGVLLNILPIASNSGKMPVSMPMARVANIGPQLKKLVEDQPMVRHCVMSDKTRFNWLADWIPVPRPPFYIDATVASPGDVVATAGMFILIQAAMCTRRRKAGNEGKA